MRQSHPVRKYKQYTLREIEEARADHERYAHTLRNRQYKKFALEFLTKFDTYYDIVVRGNSMDQYTDSHVSRSNLVGALAQVEARIEWYFKRKEKGRL